MNLVALPAFTDNYIWMLHDGVDALVVDPGEAGPVLQALSAASLRLAGILVTHHHGDHVGGLPELRPHLQGPVHGPANEQISGIDQRHREGDRFTLMGLQFEVIEVPGHTLDHIAFVLRDPGDGAAPILFCGDTLFSAGCGRLFEGTPAQMHASLARLAELPGETRVCCAHEYTLSNLKFARSVEPANDALLRHELWCRAQRDRALPTLPSSVALERAINPFMRTAEPQVAAAVPAANPKDAVAVLAALRQWKNEFR